MAPVCLTCPDASPFGATLEEVQRLIEEAVALHIAGLREDGLPVPEPQTRVTTIEVG